MDKAGGYSADALEPEAGGIEEPVELAANSNSNLNINEVIGIYNKEDVDEVYATPGLIWNLEPTESKKKRGRPRTISLGAAGTKEMEKWLGSVKRKLTSPEGKKEEKKMKGKGQNDAEEQLMEEFCKRRIELERSPDKGSKGVEKKEEKTEGEEMKEKEEENVMKIVLQEIRESRKEREEGRKERERWGELMQSLERKWEDTDKKIAVMEERIKKLENAAPLENAISLEETKRELKELKNSITVERMEKRREKEETDRRKVELEKLKDEVKKIKEKEKKEREEVRNEMQVIMKRVEGKINERQRDEEPSREKAREIEEIKEEIKKMKEAEKQGSEKGKKNKDAGRVAEEKNERKWEEWERERKRKNIIIKGMKIEDRIEKKEIEEWIKEKLDVESQLKKIWVVRKANIIGAECKDEEEKEKIMRNKSRLRDTSIYIENDLTYKERENRKRLLEKAREERSKGKEVRVMYNKIKIGEQELLWDEWRKKFFRRD